MIEAQPLGDWHVRARLGDVLFGSRPWERLPCELKPSSSPRIFRSGKADLCPPRVVWGRGVGGNAFGNLLHFLRNSDLGAGWRTWITRPKKMDQLFVWSIWLITWITRPIKMDHMFVYGNGNGQAVLQATRGRQSLRSSSKQTLRLWHITKSRAHSRWLCSQWHARWNMFV